MTTSEIIVQELLIYPIKSCGAIKVNEAQTTRYGLSLPSSPLLSDRRWMVIEGVRQQNQRHFPRMALIQPQFTSTGLQLTAPGMSPLTIPFSPLPKDIIELEHPVIKGRRYGGNIAEWFSTFLEKSGLDLVYFDDEFEPQKTKNIEPEYPNEALDFDAVAYQDMSPFHLGSLESIDDLNKRLPNPITIYNYRPNIIVNGVDKPYGEDYWREIQIGDHVKLRWFRSCLRCLLPNVNQETGIRDSQQEPWKTLQTFRRKPELYGIKGQFGIYLATSENGIMRVGDRVQILKEDKNF
ncbi:unnamed protein product [Rotaria socialis]|uniref:MOSC domain-containing protein n=3 Tax=Rotaria socialis TaxID=392032 RepID=A0A817XKQ7_9BILA|nr:unnamed protein product [Rotaria socialis]CAF3368367.1 unnamed protein product [Rotaria socialis]CAF3633946.1 unnamed protein product [Rotaria socialis]CAF3653547.1 unnamed protein product [Rotaria socialis]CAF3674613.1 unnamed protein product [Rotaria socialis]